MHFQIGGNVSHQPFETWLLDEDQSLTLEERRALREHIATCTQCQRFEHKWQDVHQELRARRMVAPAPGFTQRWQASLAERRAREQRKQAWRIFGVFMGISLLVLLLLTSYTLATSTPAQWLDAFMRSLSSSNAILQYSIYIFQNWLTGTPLVVHVTLWIYLTMTLCFLSLLWIMILWRTKTVGATSYEH